MLTIPEDHRITEIGAALEAANLRSRRASEAHLHEQAAVALVLRLGADLDFLLVRRAKSESDPWSGHMAMPGGRRQNTDASLLVTAIRETAEETGIQLKPEWALGQLGSVSPLSRRLPSLKISPFVFAAPADVVGVPDGTEIASVHWVPLDHLYDPGLDTTVEIPLIGTVREFPAYELDGQMVWGLTYRILSEFRAAYRGVSS